MKKLGLRRSPLVLVVSATVDSARVAAAALGLGGGGDVVGDVFPSAVEDLHETGSDLEVSFRTEERRSLAQVANSSSAA